MKITNTPNSHMFLLFILLSFSLQAQLRPIVVESARLSAVVYEKSIPQAIITHENILFGNRLAAFRDQKEKILYLVIRGSAKIGNWVSNLHVGTSNNLIELALLKLIPKASEVTKTWFMGAFDDLDHAAQDILSRYPHDKIVFTGHSYGGLMANLLAQKALDRHPNRRIECHTFNAPGGLEIRRKTLKLPTLPEEALQNNLFNHRRWSDLVGHWNTHEGSVLLYKASRLKDPIEEHQMDQFAKDLASGLEPISNDL